MITLFAICLLNMVFWGRYLVDKTIKYDKYALELWISTELASENHFYKAKMKIYKESVFHRLLNLFTMRF